MSEMIASHLLEPDRGFPNNPALPLLVYRGAVGIDGDDPAATFERLFRQHGWTGAWRDGVFPFHHYHSNAHEVLGVAAGEARIQFGGPNGPEVDVEAGDVVVLPAGTAHKRIDASADFLVIGAYPAGQERYDTLRGEEGEFEEAKRRIPAVELPEADPVFGPGGPLLEHWSAA